MGAGEHSDHYLAASRTPANWAAFVATLCIAIVIDNAPYPRIIWDAWITRTAIEDPIDVFARAAWVLLAAWTLGRPNSVIRYTVLCVMGASVILSKLPTVPNHWVLELGVFIGSLLTLLIARETKQRFLGLRVLLLGSILVAYTWAFVHKLNWGFFDPKTSCGAVFLESLAWRLDLPTPVHGVRAGAVYAVLLAEGAMPLLLLGSRLRGIAVSLGIGLHFMFGLFVPGFSLFMWATYFMLLPVGSIDSGFSRIAKARAWTLRQMPKRVRQLHLPGWLKQTVVLLLLLAAILLIKDVPTLRGLTQQETLWLPLAFFATALLASGLHACRMRLPMVPPTPRVLAAAVLLPLLLLINGAVPYFGIRNALAFSMFSNLRTENARSNHLLLPSLETRFSVLGDQIKVLESSDPVLQAYARPQNRVPWNWTALIARGERADFELPFFMVRYRAQQVRDSGELMFSIRFKRDGAVHELSADEVDALAPVGKLSSWLHWSKGTPLPPDRDACMW